MACDGTRGPVVGAEDGDGAGDGPTPVEAVVATVPTAEMGVVVAVSAGGEGADEEEAEEDDGVVIVVVAVAAWQSAITTSGFLSTKDGAKEYNSMVRSDGSTGIGWLTGSNPSLILLAFWLSFSQAWARICSACTDVRCAGVGLVASQTPLLSRERLLRRHDFRYVRILLRALSANSGNCRVHESIMA